ncbi:hypothetical protein HGT70_14300 [Rosenbergiella collisarenosi]|uniref:hypothetical protein n=1 Tax=Rosenbergiella collisarenosi TaxID=1544695 RepID=UPI001BDA6DCE|nr:hypothetical protein [Rosenbergiella collisarenosi]MBT0722446.1 hypothetical protein [Rosenbergiella collisarenosi]
MSARVYNDITDNLLSKDSDIQLIEDLMMVYAGGIMFVVGVLLFIFAPRTLGIRGKGHPVVVMLLGVIISGIGLYKHNVNLSEFHKSLAQSKNP